MPRLFLLFNHELTPEQEAAVWEELGVTEIVVPPPELQARWRQIPPDLDGLAVYLRPLRDWLQQETRPGDYLLVQGDFGATYLMVRYACARRLVPIYATTQRQAQEERQPDGCVRLVHYFRHHKFRRYGE